MERVNFLPTRREQNFHYGTHSSEFYFYAHPTIPNDYAILSSEFYLYLSYQIHSYFFFFSFLSYLFLLLSCFLSLPSNNRNQNLKQSTIKIWFFIFGFFDCQLIDFLLCFFNWVDDLKQFDSILDTLIFFFWQGRMYSLLKAIRNMHEIQNIKKNF